MILLLDQGNTRLKWALVDGNHRLHSRGVVGRDEGVAAMVGQMPGRLPPNRVLLASVAGSDANSRLAEDVRDAFGVVMERMVARNHCAGLYNGYQDPTLLGVDRWMAILGAWSQVKKSCLVVDAGTALTIDAVAGDHHIGGYILPGLRMQRQTLGQSTALIGVSSDAGILTWGRTTSSAVANGTLLSAVATIERALVELQGCVDDTCSLFVTGGDAREIVPLLSVAAIVNEDLVFRGMMVQGVGVSA